MFVDDSLFDLKLYLGSIGQLQSSFKDENKSATQKVTTNLARKEREALSVKLGAKGFQSPGSNVVVSAPQILCTVQSQGAWKLGRLAS